MREGIASSSKMITSSFSDLSFDVSAHYNCIATCNSGHS